MKKGAGQSNIALLFLFYLLFAGFLTSCSPGLSKHFVQENKTIYIEQWGSYFPEGFESLMSSNYPGVLALGDQDFIFDADGPGSRPWMSSLQPFTFNKSNINSVSISDSKLFGKRVLTVKLINGKTFEFLISNGEDFCAYMKKWLKYQTNKNN